MNVSTHTVRISNLPEQFDEDDFTSMCQNINPKSKTRFFRNNNTGEMEFKSKKEAERCIEEYDEMDIDGGCLRVEVISIAHFLCSLFSFAFCVCVCVSSLFFVDQTPLYLMKNSSSPPRARTTTTPRRAASNNRTRHRRRRGQSPFSGGMNARLLSPSRGHGQRKKEYDADGLEATTSRAEEDLECDSEDERSNIWTNIKEMTFKDLKVMFEATIGRKSAYTEKDRAKLEKSTYEILSGSLEGTPRGAHDESSSDDEEGGIGRRDKSVDAKNAHQVTGHMVHCKKVPEHQQTRPKAASGKSEKKRTVEMRAEEEEKEAENKKKAIRVIDDMLKKKQKSTSTQIPKRSSTLLDVVMRKEIPPVKTIVNGGPLPVIPKLTVSSTAMDPPPPRYVQQQKQTQQTQQTLQKADENKHLDDFRIELPFGFVAPERAEPCLLIKTSARNVTERELTNLFRFFEGFQHVTVRDDTSFFGAGGEKKVIYVQFREKENAAYAKSKTDKFILDSKDPINSVLNIGYFAGYTPPSSATARDAHKATTTHPSASADNPLSAAAKLAEPPDGFYCDLCKVKFAGKHHNDAVIENCWNLHAKTNCHQQHLKSKKIEGAEYFRPKIKRHPVTGSIRLIWSCDCCQVTTGYGNALWNGHAFGKKHAEAMREKSLSANATRSTHTQDPRLKPSENPDDDLAKDRSPSKTPTARNTPVSGQLGESESKSDWLQFKEARLKKITPYEKESTDFIDELPMDGGKKVNVEVSLDGCDASYFDERMVGDLKRKIMEEDSGFVVKKFNERNVIWLYGNKTSTKSAWLRTRELRHIAAKLSERRVNTTGIWKLDGLRNLVSKGLIKEYKPEITAFIDDETKYKRDTDGKITIAEEVGNMLGMLKGSKYVTQRQTEEYLGQKLKVKYEILEIGEVKFTGYPEGVAKAWLLIREFCFLGAEEGRKREREARIERERRAEVVKNKPARNTRSCPHYDPKTNKCGWANSFKNRGRTACRYCRNDSR